MSRTGAGVVGEVVRASTHLTLATGFKQTSLSVGKGKKYQQEQTSNAHERQSEWRPNH